MKIKKNISLNFNGGSNLFAEFVLKNSTNGEELLIVQKGLRSMLVAVDNNNSEFQFEVYWFTLPKTAMNKSREENFCESKEIIVKILSFSNIIEAQDFHDFLLKAQNLDLSDYYTVTFDFDRFKLDFPREIFSQEVFQR
jgi:hypothetical protein